MGPDVVDDEGGLSRLSSPHRILASLGRAPYDLFNALGFLQGWLKKTVHLGFRPPPGICILECHPYFCPNGLAVDGCHRGDPERYIPDDPCISLRDVAQPICWHSQRYRAFHRLYRRTFRTLACRSRGRFKCKPRLNPCCSRDDSDPLGSHWFSHTGNWP